jgi:hypothetical protein
LTFNLRHFTSSLVNESTLLECKVQITLMDAFWEEFYLRELIDAEHEKISSQKNTSN